MSTPTEGAGLAALRHAAVGSSNPVKLAAVRAVLERVAPQLSVSAVAVASTVPDQPFGDDETIRGAIARAHAARTATGADVGVGIEGGVVPAADGTLRTCAWAAVVDVAGRESVGGSLAMALPPAVARLIRDEGLELGEAMDRLTGDHNTKHQQGAVGILTAGFVTRQAAYETILTYALAPLLTPKLW